MGEHGRGRGAVTRLIGGLRGDGRNRRKFLVASSFMGALAAVEPWFLLINAGNGPRISDGLDQATVPASPVFPYLAPPNPVRSLAGRRF